jgi:pSer/pThr/pTyr-binding forkhead associated (FHA) protein
MGRAGNPGGPQRVSAHVVPKAKPYPGGVDGGDTGEEEEKTTIESQWEDEASTTVEQGDVAEKVRSLKQNGNTNVTHTGSLEEPTVDDQHAPVLSAITPLRVDQNARLAITQGNDTGQTFEITPGKTFSVGRAIDNDIVLTDIAVSRRHFELKHEDGAWVVIDHRSGNGTVVNGNVEDNPFMLANGDVIEIGNTVFRFEQDKGPERPQRIHHEDDEEELSTVAGKPLRAEIVDEPPSRPPVMQPRPARPKTLPPPTPLRSIGASQPPPLGLPPMAPQPASTLPLPQMANRPPATAAPTMLGDSMGMPIGQMPISQLHQPLGSMPPTTIPGQGAPRQSYPYPTATEIPPHSVHAQMLLIQTQNRRGDASTAHVPPMSFDPMGYAQQPPMMQQQRYSQPQISQRAKYIAAAAAIAVVAAIATIGIVKSGDNKKPSTSANTNGAGSATPPKKNVAIQPITPTTPKQEAPKPQVATTPPTPQVATTTTSPTPSTPKQEPPKKEEIKQEPPKQDPPKQDPPKKDPPKQVASTTSKTIKKEKNAAARPQKKEEPKQDPAPAQKKVAVATGGDTSGARSKADDLYKKRKFSDAASTLTAAAKTADDDEAKELRAKADYYTKLGKALNTGEAPAQEAIVAYQSLRSAANYDANVGGFYKSEIDEKLGSAASKAAFKYLANKDWQNARTAVIQAENHGAGDSVGTVKTKLESVARDLYGEAQKDNFASQNSKDMLKQIMVIVDSKSTWYQKAAKAIAASR